MSLLSDDFQKYFMKEDETIDQDLEIAILNGIKRLENKTEKLSDAIHAINCTEDSYNLEVDVLSDIYLICESVRSLTNE